MAAAKKAPKKVSSSKYAKDNVVRFLSYRPDMDGGQFMAGDIIRLVEVKENYLEDAMGGLVIERDGVDVSSQEICEELYFDECEPIGTYEAYLSEKPAEESTDTPAPAAEETANLPAVKKKSNKSSEQELVSDGQNTLMSYLNRADLHKAAMDVSRISNASNTVLAALLHGVYDSGLYKHHVDTSSGEEENFETYIKQNYAETLHYRKALYLVKSYAFLQRMGLNVNTICEIGYMKIQELLSLEENRQLLDEDPDLIKRLAERAKTLTKEQLRQEVADAMQVETTLEDTASSKEKFHKVTLAMFKGGFDRFNDILTEYKDRNGIDNDAIALLEIMEEYVNLTNAATPSLEYDLQNFEARHGVKLQVVETIKK